MSDPTSEITYTVTIASLEDEASRMKVAAALAKVSKGISQDQIHARLARLPWTVSKSAGQTRAEQLVALLERLGARIDVSPPLPKQREPESLDAQAIEGISDSASHEVAAKPTEVGKPGEIKPVGTFSRDKSPSLPAQSVPPAPTDYSLQPLSLTGILDKSFDICKGHLGKLFLILVIPTLVMFLIVFLAVGGVLLLGITTDMKNLFSGPGGPVIIVSLALVGIGAFIIFFIITYMAQAAIIYAVSAIYLGQAPKVIESYRLVMGKLGKFILTSMLFMFVILASLVVTGVVSVGLYFLLVMLFGKGVLAIVITALVVMILLLAPTYLALKLMLFDKAVIVEDLAYTEALKRSWRLLTGKADSQFPRGYFVRLVILLHVFVAIYFGISMLFMPVSLIVEFALPQDLRIIGSIVGNILSSAAGIIAQVYFGVCLVVFYYDIRNRKEGFDLEKLVELRR